MDSGVHPVYFFPSCRLSVAALSLQAGLLATGSSYSPEPSHPVTPGSGISQVFVPGYSGGTAPDSNRLPY